MAGVLQPAEQIAIDEEGAGEAHIHQVRPAQIGVVDDVDVARFRRGDGPFADQPDQVAGGMLHGADEDRKAAFALRDECAVLGGVDAVGAVVSLGDHGREGGTREGQVHLVADLLQAGLDDGEGQRVHAVQRSGE